MNPIFPRVWCQIGDKPIIVSELICVSHLTRIIKAVLIKPFSKQHNKWIYGTPPPKNKKH